MNRAIIKELKRFSNTYGFTQRVLEQKINPVKLKQVIAELKGENAWDYEGRLTRAKDALLNTKLNRNERSYATGLVSNIGEYMKNQRKTKGKVLNSHDLETMIANMHKPSTLDRVKNLGVAAVTAASMMLSTVALGQNPITIKPIEAQIGQGNFFKLRDGEAVTVPYDQDIYLVPQETTIKKNGRQQRVRTEILLQRFDHETGNWLYATDDFGNRLVVNGRINPEDYGIRQGERVKLHFTFEDLDNIYQSATIYLVQGLDKTSTRFYQAEAKDSHIQRPIMRATELPQRTNSEPRNQFELKAIGLLGDEKISDDTENRSFKGIMLEAVGRGKNYQAWANMLYQIQDRDVAYTRGNVLSQSTNQLSLGLDARIASILVGELEFIHSRTGFDSRYHHLVIPIDESKYNGIFYSGGIFIPFGEGGFASNGFLTATYGAGRGTQEYSLTDNLYYDATYDSMTLNEKNYWKVHAFTPYLEATYSRSDVSNTQNTLEGKRESIGGKISIPLSAISSSLSANVYLTGFVNKSKIEQTGDAAAFTDYSNTMIGAGVTFRFGGRR